MHFSKLVIVTYPSQKTDWLSFCQQVNKRAAGLRGFRSIVAMGSEAVVLPEGLGEEAAASCGVDRNQPQNMISGSDKVC